MKHLADELDSGRFVGVLLLEVHDEAKRAILEGRVGWADDDGVPTTIPLSVGESSCSSVVGGCGR